MPRGWGQMDKQLRDAVQHALPWLPILKTSKLMEMMRLAIDVTVAR